jgi:type VI secretion system protein ImpE
MQAEERLREGRLDEALAALQDEVRARPAEPRLRVFLFQLLSVLGQWDRALNQLAVLGEMDAGSLAMVHTYRQAIRCEALRREVFAGRRTPLVFGEPEEWIALLIEALRCDAGGRDAQAAELRARALEAAPARAGRIDGDGFEWIADGDGRLGPVLEAIVDGRYGWLPFERLEALELEEPTDLRDAVWAPASLRWASGGGSVALIPTRYPGAESWDDHGLRLGRRTEWQEASPDLWIGVGQRMLVTDAGEHALLDVREVRMVSAAGGGDVPAPGGAVS